MKTDRTEFFAEKTALLEQIDQVWKFQGSKFEFGNYLDSQQLSKLFGGGKLRPVKQKLFS